MRGSDIDMRLFARKAGASVIFPAGSVVFCKGDPGPCMFVVQSGVIEMVIGENCRGLRRQRGDRIHVDDRRFAALGDRSP
jgi:CRP-like cAMP-binding protein